MSQIQTLCEEVIAQPLYVSTRPRQQSTQAISSADHSPAPPHFPQKHDKDKKIEPRGVVSLEQKKVAIQENQVADFKRRKELEKELLWLQDPLKLADNTIDLLRKDEDEKALELIRMASKRSQCTVSWNHVIDYEMSKGRVQKAEKVYNERVFLEH
ncbi:MAG: hypothetical protein L6R41_007527 [Letrouitia leprolyta]|nr:MAG: hypothetical protein L6R41_007527 [Letrouitia leprolyta]